MRSIFRRKILFVGHSSLRYGSTTVRNFLSIWLALCLGTLLTHTVRADTFETTTGQKLSGEAVSFNEKGVVIRLDDGSYADRIDWGKLTQETLAKLSKVPKAVTFVEPFLEPTEEELAAAEKTALVIKTDYDKLERPARRGLIPALFSTGIGWLAFLLIYAGNIYAGYEVSVFRARPVGLVCGVSAALPVIGPIIFLCLPTQVESKEDIIQEPAVERESYTVGTPTAVVAAKETQRHHGHAAPAASQYPPTQSFARGQFTFNRRFIETKFPGWFGMVKRDAEKDMQLVFKSAKGTFVADRITRATASEINIETHQDGSLVEVMLTYPEIQEIVLKHKDA